MRTILDPSAPMSRCLDRSLAEEALQHLLDGQSTVSVVPLNQLKITADKAEHIFPADYCETCAIPQDCKQHGPLRSLRKLAKDTRPSSVVSNTSTNSKLLLDCHAISTLPREVCLCTSGIPEAGFGICSRVHIRANTWMGPFEGRMLTPDEILHSMNTEHMWEVYDNGRLLHYIDASDANCSNWMRFVQCARNCDEQNMQAVQYNKLIYYRSTREILPAEELLVWYDPGTYVLTADVPIGIKEDGAYSPMDSQIGGSSSHVFYTPSKRFGSPPVSAPSSSSSSVNQMNKSDSERRSITSIPQLIIDDDSPPSGKLYSRRQSLRDYQDNDYSPSPFILQSTSLKSPPPGLSRAWQRPIFMHSPYPTRQRFPTVISAATGGYFADLSRNRGTGWQCGQCRQTFGQRLILQTHKCPQSSIDQPYQCGLCLASFGNTAELHTHVAGLCSATTDVPNAERPFRCAFCSRTFAGTTTLQNHIRTHTGEKPYHCERCHEEFARMVQLTRHSCTWTSRTHSSASTPSEGESVLMPESTSVSPPPGKTAESERRVQSVPSMDVGKMLSLSERPTLAVGTTSQCVVSE